LIPGRYSRTESDGGEIRPLAPVRWAWHQLNDLGAHEHPSQTAMAINPTSASDTRYAVIGSSFEIKLRHDRKADHFRREPYPHQGAACDRGFQPTPRAGTFAHAG